MSIRRTPPSESSAIKEANFSVLENTETNSILKSGKHEDMVYLSEVYNKTYQTDAYVVERWRD